MFNQRDLKVFVRAVGVVVVFLASPVFAESSWVEAPESSTPTPEGDGGLFASAASEEEIAAAPAVGDSTSLEIAGGEPALAEKGLVDSPAGAEDPERHGVFFLRMQLGVGTMEQSGVDDGMTVDAGGIAAFYSIALGASVLPNLALYGELAIYEVLSADLFVDGRKNPRSVDYRGEELLLALPQSIDYTGVGGGLAYYVMPVNVYVSASFNFVSALVHRDDFVSVFYWPGYVGRFAIGKEWWTAMQGFGLGLAATATVGKLEDLSLSGMGLALSGTYN